MESKVPTERVLDSGTPPREAGVYVACALGQARRTYWNFALQRAGDWSRELALPLVVVETFPSASMDSLERRRFLFDGIASTARRLFLAGVTYHPFVEREPGAGKDLLGEIGMRAAILVSDLDLVGVSAAPVEIIDSEHLLPRSVVLKLRSTAIQDRLLLARGEFRRRLTWFPERNPLVRLGVDPLPGLAARITSRWPVASSEAWPDDSDSDTTSPTGEPTQEGGADRARGNWRALLADRAADAGTSAQDAALGSERLLWRHLAAGHISPHQVVAETMRHLEWTPAKLAATDDAPAGTWWGMAPPFERLLDELLVAEHSIADR